jgi:cytochrome P450
MTTPESQFDPYAAGPSERLEAMAQIRDAGGIVDTPAGKYIATAAGVTAGLKDVEKFVGSFIDTSSLHPDDVMISAIPEPEHGRIRRVINSVVAPHRTHEAEDFIQELCIDLVDRALEVAASNRGRVDLVDMVSDPLPSSVIAHMLGVPVDMQKQFQVWSDELLQRQNDGAQGGLADAHSEFAAYIQGLIDDRRADPDRPDDVISRFIETDIDGEYLSDRMIRTQVMFLIVAGNETTRNLISHCFHKLAEDQDLFDQLQSDPGLVEPFIEETLRLEAPVQILARAVLEETTIEGCPLHEGDKVVFGLASANRDDSVHEAPNELRLDRPRARDHLAFGAGPHVCPGATLARVETQTMVEELLRRVASIRLVDGFEPTPNPVFWASGHKRLDTIIEPA